MRTPEIIGYAKDGAIYCPNCAGQRFEGLAQGDEGFDFVNEGVSTIYETDETSHECVVCQGSGTCETSCSNCGDDTIHNCYSCEGAGMIADSCDTCGNDIF